MINFGIGKGKHLETTRIGKSWTMPASEFGEATGFFDKLWTRRKNEVVSVGENALGSKFTHLLASNGFDGSASSGTDEGWSFNIAVWRMDNAGTHEAILFFDVEF